MKREKRLIHGIPYEELASKLCYFCKTIPHDQYETYKILSNGKSFRFRELLFRPDKFLKIIRSLKNGFPATIRLKLIGASIKIKNSGRLFYPDQIVKVQKRKLAYSAKIGLASAFRDGNLTQEISSKLFIEKNVPKFPIPKTISYDEINQFWFIEKYVNESRKFSNQKKASIFLSAYAVDYYSPFFFPMTLERFLSKHHITVDLIHGIFQDAGEPIAALDNLGTLAAAYAHGDLSPINIIIDEHGRLYVVDWEHFGIDSVAFDLVKLLRIDPRLALTVLTNISKCGPGCSIPALQQFKIALGVQIILARRDYKNIFSYHTRHGGSDKSKTQLLLLNSEKDSLFFLSKLNEFIP